jgi:hypothetical protein
MCDFATASYVATALGTAAAYEGGQQTKSAMSKVQQAESERQRKFRSQAAALFDESIGSEGVDATTNAEAAAVKAREQAAVNAQSGGVSAPISSSYGEKSNIVSDETKVRSTAGRTAAGMESKAKAKLAGFGDAAQLKGIKNAHMLQGQGVIAGNMAGSASASGAELDYAGHAGDSMKNLGAGLSTIGTLTGLAAASGVGATTAEDLAKESISKTGTAVGPNGETIMANGTGGYNLFDPRTGSYNMNVASNNVNWASVVDPSKLARANQPAILRPFMSAPTIKPAVTASSDWFNIPAIKPMNTTLKPLEPFSL